MPAPLPMTDKHKLARAVLALEQIATMEVWTKASHGRNPARGQTRADGYDQACNEAARIAMDALATIKPKTKGT